MEFSPRNWLHADWTETTGLELPEEGITCSGISSSSELHVRVHRCATRGGLLLATVKFGCTEGATWFGHRSEHCAPSLRVNVEAEPDNSVHYVTAISFAAHNAAFLNGKRSAHFVVSMRRGRYTLAAVVSREKEARVLLYFPFVESTISATLDTTVLWIPHNGSRVTFSYGHRELRMFLLKIRLLASAQRVERGRWSLLDWVTFTAPAWVPEYVCDFLRDPCADT